MGFSIVVIVGVILVDYFLCCIIWNRKCYNDQLSKNIQSGISLPICVNNIDSSAILLESIIDHGENLASRKMAIQLGGENMRKILFLRPLGFQDTHSSMSFFVFRFVPCVC